MCEMVSICSNESVFSSEHVQDVFKRGFKHLAPGRAAGGNQLLGGLGVAETAGLQEELGEVRVAALIHPGTQTAGPTRYLLY